MNTQERTPPKVFEHLCRVFAQMKKEAIYVRVDDAGDQEETLIWEGFLTKLFQNLGLPQPYYCLDDETEILTQVGWKQHSVLQAGDTVLTLDNTTGYSTWDRVEDVHRFEVVELDMIRMSGRNHSSLSTRDHRWPVLTGTGVRKFKTSETLASQDAIPCAAPCRDTPDLAKWSDAFVEVVAWFQTEGTLLNGNVSFSQSEAVHPENCARIRAALDIFCPGEWSEYRQGTRGRIWRLGARATREVLQVVGLLPATDGDSDVAKVLSCAFVSQLTNAQLGLLVEIGHLGDGTYAGGTRQLKQKRKEALEAYSLALALLGIRTSLYLQKDPKMWVLSSINSNRPYIRPKRAQYQSNNTTFSITSELYTGTIWCPTTANATWYARRDGQVYFTGNTTVMGHLKVMGCVQQLSRGGGNAPSRWELIDDPTLQTFLASNTRKRPNTTRVGALEQRIADLSTRITQIEDRLELLLGRAS